MPSDIEKTGVSLLIKRDRQSLFHKEPVKVPHELRRPRFSFSIFNCQRTDGKTVKTSRRNSRPDQSASANQGNLKTKDIVASSAAALVSDRAYRGASARVSTGNFVKLTQTALGGLNQDAKPLSFPTLKLPVESAPSSATIDVDEGDGTRKRNVSARLIKEHCLNKLEMFWALVLAICKRRMDISAPGLNRLRLG